ncbi:carbohydrate esterase family 8 protein [Karstenula rhodostoma CBS 690.94]|uniref:Pectinesterase n=1 Tax=Karstenula rhodostoma CBS 690.94 TaxID=1392251 RepID=A0A9P4P621_9PLEO|nr:carbohydrate esterase family 8 protein [Karstenula rhodostoma CBS 690.94]
MWSVLTFVTLLATGLAAPLDKRASRTSPPSGCLSVGSGYTYSTISAAVKALSKTSTSSQCIWINQGTYKEQVSINSLKGPLVLYGYTSDTSSYTSNKVTITYNLSQASGVTNDGSATLRAETGNLKVYNINIVNSYGKGSQAVAVSAQGDKTGFYGVSFKGFQDTLLANNGAQVYAKCYIEGATDFIFGMMAAAWFDGVDIRVLAGGSYITANGRDSSSNPSYYVINKSTVAVASGQSVAAKSYYLGRPWRNYSRVVFQNTSLSNVINAAGWHSWGTDEPKTDHVEYGEYGNTGAGASGTRASFAKKLSSAVSISTVLGGSYTSWVDTSYLS